MVAVAVKGDAPRRLLVGPPSAPEEVWFSPIGRNGGGDLFMQGTGRSSGRGVWKWSHETTTRFDGLADQAGCTFIAATFTGFLGRVSADWQAFVGATPDWRYI